MFTFSPFNFRNLFTLSVPPIFCLYVLPSFSIAESGIYFTIFLLYPSYPLIRKNFLFNRNTVLKNPFDGIVE